MKNLRYNNILLRALTILCLMMASMGAWAADYVIKSGTNFLIPANGGKVANATTFTPNTCIWSGNSGGALRNKGNNSTTLSYSTNRLGAPNGLTTGGTATWTINGNRLYYDGLLADYGVNYNNGWTISGGNTNNVIYQVVTGSAPAGISDFEVSGSDIISKAGSYSYAHTNALRTTACTTYTFDGVTYYSTNDAQAASTTQPGTEITTGYTWTLTGGGSYASVNASSGQITVNSMPADDIDMTLTCTVNGKSASMTVTLSGNVATEVGYVIYSGGNNGEYLANAAEGTSEFSPKTCIWVAESDGSYTNGTYYLRNNDAFLGNSGNRSTTVILGDTENGTTGRTLRLSNNGRYLRYNNNGWVRDNSASNVVFVVKKKSGDGSQILPTISGRDSFTDLGNETYSKTNAEYTPSYNNYIFYNNTNHYFTQDDNTYLGNTEPTSEEFDYVWSLSDEAEGHVTVNPSTGALSYTNLFDSDTEVTLTLTATSRTTHTVLTAEKAIQFVLPVLDPTSINASDIDYIMVDDNHNIGATLTCATPNYPNIYNHITYTSKNTEIATVDAAGQVTGVAAGTAVVTITAGLQGGGSITKDISVVVKDNCVAPTITFSNVDNTLTMSTTTPNAKIYYTIDGHDPTAASSVYDPAHKPVLSAAETVKAITISNDAAHYINSPITTLAVGKVATPTVTINGEQVVIACTTPDVTLHYTTDGSDPTASSPTTSGTIDGLAIGTNVKVIAVKEGMINSNVATKVVKYNVPQPVLSFDGTEVTMTCTLDGAKIYYTTNGNNPTTSSTLYDPAAKPTFTNPATVKAIAAKDGYENSAATTLEITRTATPGITVSSTSVTLACATPGVTYYYTTDGSEPTSASASTTGTTLDDTQVPPGATLKVMAVGSNLLPSTIASKEVNFELTAPEIEIDGGTVTITGPAGATVHYTTDGTEPTESSPTYTAPFPATNGMTYKAIAMKAGYTPSDITTEKYMIATGVANGVVTLNDYEDHTWTYYAGVEIGGYKTKDDYKGKLYSPNPRNVKITYNGKGKIRTADDASELIDVPEGTRVSVGLGAESENVFVYYKTLERNANNRYEYTTIPNPFQVRPTYSSDTETKWRGFQTWRIVSITKGAIYTDATGGTALAAGDMLTAETAYYFVPTDADGTGYTPNCTSMEIELEAVWARAYVNENQNVGFERNFRVITANSDNAPTRYSNPTTYSSVYPNGCTTANGTTLATGAQYRVGANVAFNNDTKFEYITLRNINNNSSTLDANCHNLVIGRGVVGYNGGLCASQIRGNAADDMDFMLRIESGSYTTFHALKSGGDSYSGICKVRSVLGCDYDRAKRDNSKLNITTNMWMGQSCKFSTANNRTQGFYKCWIKSGDLLSGVTVNGSNGTGGTQSFYYGTSGNQSTALHIYPRYLWMEGGQVAGLAGGLDDRSVTTDNEQRVYLRMTGGFVRGPIYGAGAYAVAAGRRNYIFTGGEVGGWIAAGCNGIGNNTTSTNNGTTTGDSFVYVGGTVRVGYKGTTVNSVEGGNVFGAGRGAPVTTYDVGTVNNSNVVIADEAMVEKNVYGGGNYGFSKGEANIYITGGTVDGNVFGGSNMMKGYTPNIYMTGGLVKTGVYGGCNTEGTINNSVTMQINGGQVGVDAAHTGNVHGGGYGQKTVVAQNIDITLGKTGAARDADGVTVWGDVYGGSALGSVNGTAATNTYHTNVTMNAGYIHGSIYGGALGSNTIAANVYGPVQVKVYGGSVFNTDGTGANGSGAVYGANNINGAPQRSVTVDIYGTNSAPAEGEYALFSVYGGGNAADYTYGNGYPTVTVHNCDNSIEYVYGGGNAAAVAATDVTIYGGDKIGNVFGGGNGQVRAANVTGGTNVKIYGGTIGDVYGGSNTQGTIGGTINVNVNAQAEGGSTACLIDIDNVYGGGNKAASNVGNVTIGCAEHIGAVYGGANQANVTGNITLNIVSGHIDNVFGGNNNSGNITGNITVNVNDNGSSCGMAVGNVYGGGNLAKYGTGGNFPVVNIINGALTGSVFGGGKGETAVVTGNPQVNISDWNDAHEVTIGGNVFGGGDAAEVVGTPVVIIKDCDTEITGNIYGGGNAAAVSGTNLTIWGGRAEQVFGGGNGLVSPADVNGNASAKIYGGTFTEVYGGSNSQGDISGTISVEVNEHKSTETGASLCQVNIDDLYGGGNMADSKAGSISIGKCEHIGRVFGGANKANIEGDITLNITDGHIDNVFGGNNNSGQVSGNITVNVNWANGVNAENARVGNVYGGGNIASIDNGTPRTVTVNIPNATVSGSVFGGGKGKEAVIVGSTNVNIGSWTSGAVTIAGTDASHPGDVFGGGDLAAVEGPCNITIRDCNTLITGDLYGGGNAAPVFSTNTTMWGGLVAGNVFGGGNGKDAGLNPNGAQVGYMRNDTSAGGTGVASTAILGGTVGTWVDGACTDGTGGVFGGSNTNGNIRGGIALTLDQQTCTEPGATRCPLILREIYGAGNEAAYAGTGIDFDLGCVDYLEEIYGGAKAADLNANASLHIRSGHFKRVFGGNNVSGKLNGTITVTIEEMGCNPIVIDELYGGGNLAPYSVYGYAADGTPLTSGDAKADPQINILSCTHIGTVFGGGLGASAVMVGNPRVNIQEVLGDFPKRHYNTATKTVSDGTNGEADELGSIGTVYGGGNEAKVDGDTHILVGTEADKGAYILGNVYGGGNQADVTGKTNVTVGK